MAWRACAGEEQSKAMREARHGPRAFFGSLRMWMTCPRPATPTDARLSACRSLRRVGDALSRGLEIGGCGGGLRRKLRRSGRSSSVNLELPPRFSSGARSSNATRAPLSVAASAAHKAALPPDDDNVKSATFHLSRLRERAIRMFQMLERHFISVFRVRSNGCAVNGSLDHERRTAAGAVAGAWQPRPGAGR